MKITAKTLFEFFFIGIISLLFFFLIWRDIGAAYYSAVGDEYIFFNLARSIVLGEKKLSLFKIPGHLSVLDLEGIYGFTPAANSIFQALVMKIFGLNHWGWIASSIVAVILSMIFLFLFSKELFGQKGAICTLLFYACSHYLWAFTHLGYSHIQGIYILFASLYVFIKGLRKQNYPLLFGAGLISGFCFYGSHFSMISPLLIFMYFIFSGKFLKKIKGVLIYLVGFLTIFIPCVLINYRVFSDPVMGRSLLGSTEIPDGRRFIYFWKNIGISFLAFFKNNRTSHFVSGSLIDPISGLFLAIGLLTIIWFWREYKFIIVKFILLLVMVGGLSQYPYVAITRLYFLLPTVSLIAALGYLSFEKMLLSLKLPKLALFSITVIIFLAVFILNYYRFYYQTPKKMDLTKEALVMGAVQACPVCRNQALIICDPPNHLIRSALDSHNLFDRVKLVNNNQFSFSIFDDIGCLIILNKNSNSFSGQVLGIKKSWDIINYYSPSGRQKVEVIFSLK